MIRSCTAATIPLPVITPEDSPILSPAASTPALRQLSPSQSKDQLWASTSKQMTVQMMRSMRRSAFFMSSITNILTDFSQ